MSLIINSLPALGYNHNQCATLIFFNVGTKKIQQLMYTTGSTNPPTPNPYPWCWFGVADLHRHHLCIHSSLVIVKNCKQSQKNSKKRTQTYWATWNSRCYVSSPVHPGVSLVLVGIRCRCHCRCSFHTRSLIILKKLWDNLNNDIIVQI